MNRVSREPSRDVSGVLASTVVVRHRRRNAVLIGSNRSDLRIVRFDVIGWFDCAGVLYASV